MKKNLNKYYPEATGLVVFAVYLFTLGRSMGEFDSGELALAQATLSIPHPTGYPLFTLIGFLFSKIPLPLSTLIKLNLLNAIWCSLSVVMLIKTSQMLLDNLRSFVNKKVLESEIDLQIQERNKILISIFPGFMMAFSATFWLNSTKVEVYSLQIFLTSLIIYNSLKIYIHNLEKNPEQVNKNIFKDWFLLALLFGFAFSNHLMIVYLLPATLILYFFLNGINKQSIKALAILLLIVLSTASVFYLLMMFRAQMTPPWSYGDPSNIQRLFDHITAKEYTKHLLASSEGLLQQGSKLFKMLSFNLNYENFSLGEFGLSLFLGIAGLLLIAILKKEIAIYLYLILIVSITTALIYHIPDINEYFLVTFYVMSLSSILPITILLQTFDKKILVRRMIFSLLAVFVGLQVIINYKYADRSEFFVIEDFIKSSLRELPSNSVLLTDNWGSILSPALYYQNVEKFRDDVQIISPSGFIEFDWYKKIKAVDIYDSNFVIIPREDTYVAFDVAYRIIGKGILKIHDGYSLIPMGNFFMIGKSDLYYAVNISENKIRFSKYLFSDSEKYIKALIPFMLEQRLLYELAFNKTENAKILLNEIHKLFSEHSFSEVTLRELIKNKIL